MEAFDTRAGSHSTIIDAQASSFDKSRLRKNGILAALPIADLDRLLPHLQPAILPSGMPLRRAGENAANVYFPESGVAGLLHTTVDGQTTELALTGSEGMIGVESFLSGIGMPMETVMLCAGRAYRIPASRLTEVFYRSNSMRRILLRYAQSLLTQIEQTAVCNRHHTIEQRFCRLLLLCLDRLTSNELVMPQDLIANMLGVRRESVTVAAKILRDAGLISYRRGHISVADRIGLESHACECYTVVKKEYERLASAKTLSEDWNAATALHRASMFSKETKFGHFSS